MSIAPPIPYYGGKQRIAAQIVAHFPEHQHYIEPYAGGLSVLLAKPPSRIETVNDLDGELMTFWRVLRDRHDDLMRVCSLTPHSRAELALCREPMVGLDELEIARRVWSQLAQGRSGRRTRTGWRFYVDGASTASGLDRYLTAYVDRMPPAAARLASVQLESLDALELIATYGRAPSNLLYVDPPYLGTTRGSMQYLHEMHDDDSHRELADVLRGVRARVVLSGYHSDLYAELYDGWRVEEIQASTQQGKAGDGARTEVLWCNFPSENHLPIGGAA